MFVEELQQERELDACEISLSLIASATGPDQVIRSVCTSTRTGLHMIHREFSPMYVFLAIRASWRAVNKLLRICNFQGFGSAGGMSPAGLHRASLAGFGLGR